MSEDKEIETDTQRMISVIENASVNPDVNPEKMRQLLDIQLVIMDRQAKIEFDQAMAECQSEMAGLRIIREAYNDQTKSKYATHEAICAAIKPVYTKHGFRLSFSEGKADIQGEIRTHCSVTHRCGHTEAHSMDLPYDSAGIRGTVNKTPIHAKGSTFSYGRRYLTLMIFDLATYDDTDANRPPPVIELISEEQALALHSRAKKHGILDNFLSWLNSKNVEKIEDIAASNYEHIVKKLETSIKNKEKEYVE